MTELEQKQWKHVMHVGTEWVQTVENKCLDYNWNVPYMKKELKKVILGSIL